MLTKTFLIYLLRFGGAFCLFYFGTLAVIGLSSPENAYSPFVDRYLNFIDPLRQSLLWGAKTLLAALGHASFFRDDYTLALPTGEGVRMVYSCIGYGVMSFWTAFVFANRGKLAKKLAWVVGGLLVLWLVNVARLALLLLADKNNWGIPLGWDHHTWFNIVAYVFIFGMIHFYDRSFRSSPSFTTPSANPHTQALS